MTGFSGQALDRGSFAVGLLSVTAVVLLVGLLIVQMLPPAAYADGMTVSGGDYSMTVGSLADSDEEYLYVIDLPSSRLAVYRFDVGRDEIQIIQGIDLSRFRTPVGEVGPAQDETDASTVEPDDEAPVP